MRRAGGGWNGWIGAGVVLPMNNRPLRISASDIMAHQRCAFQHHLSRVLQIESVPGDAALQGSAFHQCLKWTGEFALAKRRILAMPRLAEWAWDTVIRSRLSKTKRGNQPTAAYIKYLGNLDKVLKSPYSPLTLHLLEVETKFELRMPDDWGEVVISGILDLVHEIDQDTIEVVDWKTGKCRDLTTQQPLDMYDLLRAVQPRIYQLAATYLYPQYRNILVTFYYVEDGGPLTIPLDDNDLPLTLAGLWCFVQKLRQQDVPHRHQGWTCRFCGYFKNGRCEKEWNRLYSDPTGALNGPSRSPEPSIRPRCA